MQLNQEPVSSCLESRMKMGLVEMARVGPVPAKVALGPNEERRPARRQPVSFRLLREKPHEFTKKSV
jgi:hypothetical protein